eukprot:808410-Amphidinium_carterae.1
MRYTPLAPRKRDRERKKDHAILMKVTRLSKLFLLHIIGPRAEMLTLIYELIEDALSLTTLAVKKSQMVRVLGKLIQEDTKVNQSKLRHRWVETMAKRFRLLFRHISQGYSRYKRRGQNTAWIRPFVEFYEFLNGSALERAHFTEFSRPIHTEVMATLTFIHVIRITRMQVDGDNVFHNDDDRDDGSEGSEVHECKLEVHCYHRSHVFKCICKRFVLSGFHTS